MNNEAVKAFCVPLLLVVTAVDERFFNYEVYDNVVAERCKYRAYIGGNGLGDT